MARGGGFTAGDEFAAASSRDGLPTPAAVPAAPSSADDREQGALVEGEETAEAAQPEVVGEAERESRAARRPPSGRRRTQPTDRPEGHYARSRLPQGTGDIAFDATLRAAAPFQRARRAVVRTGARRLAVEIAHADLREKHRTRKVGRLLVFLVDISGSMGEEIMALARRASLFLLKEAYLRRDRVAMIAFRERTAELLFAPTASVEVARRRLVDLPTGGKTPLAFGLAKAHELVRRTLEQDLHIELVLVVISDCKANVGTLPGYAAILAELDRIAAVLRAEKRVRVVLFDATEEGKDDFHASRLAESLAAIRLKVHRLRGLSDAQMQEVLRRI